MGSGASTATPVVLEALSSDGVHELISSLGPASVKVADALRDNDIDGDYLASMPDETCRRSWTNSACGRSSRSYSR